MTEQQRREQIMKMRQQAQGPAAPSLSDADAMKMAGSTNGLTQEQMIAIAMFGKVVQNDVNTIKKAGLGDMKVSDVDMSKVMPSGIAKAAGMVIPQIPAAMPVNPPVVPVMPQMALPLVSQPVAANSDSQLEFNFDKKARYEDIIEHIEKLEKKLIMVNEKLDLLLEDKKKLVTNP
jgi:hypothetical protein